MPESIEPLVRCLGYRFNDPALVELALSHRSYSANNNERLEFLGDSIVNFLIGEALFEKFPDAREGDLSRMRAELVKGKTLAELAREFSIGDFLNLGPGEMKSGGHRRESILADVVEALIGAIYKEAGMDVCRERVLSWYASRLEGISPQSSQKDAKTQLQEFLQSRKKPLPIYHLVASTGFEHDQQFEIECEVAGIKPSVKGCGGNRRTAEQNAAAEALALLQST